MLLFVMFSVACIIILLLTVKMPFITQREVQRRDQTGGAIQESTRIPRSGSPPPLITLGYNIDRFWRVVGKYPKFVVWNAEKERIIKWQSEY